ncbi:glycoside hydrolase family 25 protein [Streptomyces sp. NPDC088846]|uniref:glycoside hydrolase family 25 protein n=1 Tax=Streptomyces sp. NPDC088846 TaxID=3365908 RepID=UPI003815C6AF
MPQTSPVRVRVALTGTVVGAALVALGLIAPTVEAAPPSSYGVSGVDTSHYNHEAKGKQQGTAIDWSRVAASNSFAFLKATEGVSRKDGWFARDYAAAAETSLLRAPYHFFRPRTADDGAAQARHFVATARAAGYRGNLAGELPPVLDVEKLPAGGTEVCPKELRSDQLRIFLREVRKAFDVTPIVYTRASFVKECLGGKGGVFAGYPLWLARYGSHANEPQQVPGAGRSWTFWQYTRTGTDPGITGPVDRNVFRGSQAELRAMVRGGARP